MPVTTRSSAYKARIPSDRTSSTATSSNPNSRLTFTLFLARDLERATPIEEPFITVTYPDGDPNKSRELEANLAEFTGCEGDYLPEEAKKKMKLLETDLLVSKGLAESTSDPKSITMSMNEAIELIVKHFG